MTTPQTIKVNGFEVPAPLKEIPPHTTHVWRAQESGPDFCIRLTTTWIGPEIEKGRIHLTREAAEAHGKALRGIDPRGEA